MADQAPEQSSSNGAAATIEWIEPERGYDTIHCPQCDKPTMHRVGRGRVQCSRDGCRLVRVDARQTNVDSAPQQPPAPAQAPAQQRPAMQPHQQLLNDPRVVARYQMLEVGLQGAMQLGGALLQLGTDEGGRDALTTVLRELVNAAFDESGRFGSDSSP